MDSCFVDFWSEEEVVARKVKIYHRTYLLEVGRT